jgi:hypothetical protein
MKLASVLEVLGFPRGRRMPLANDAATTAKPGQFWKRKCAMAIGKPELEDASDDDLESAHDAHMSEVAALCGGQSDSSEQPALANDATIVTYGDDNDRAMPPGPASIVGEKQRNAFLSGEVRKAQTQQGIGYDAAWVYVRALYPQYFPTTQSTKRMTPQQIANEEKRRSAVSNLVNEKMAALKCDYDTAFTRVQADPANAELFGKMTQSIPKK